MFMIGIVPVREGQRTTNAMF